MTEITTYAYDLYLSYTAVDRAWVTAELLPVLEQRGLHVCLPERDFEIGRPRLDNLERAIAQSRHTLVVMTPAWLASEWQAFESLLVNTTDPAGRLRRLIPLLLEPCTPPPRIAMLTYADFSEPAQRPVAMKRLLRALGTQAQVFISYKRHAEPDEPLALQIRTALEQAGHQVFIDQALPVGIAWAQAINRQIEASDFLIVLLSAASVQSEMVAAEVAYAHKHHQGTGKAKVLPVRVRYKDALPYQLSHYLEPLQYAQWHDAADSEDLIRQLLDAIRQFADLQVLAEVPTTTGNAYTVSAPLYYYSSPLALSSITRHQAPPTDTNFIGRQEIINKLLSIAQTYRVILLLGIPGIGKTVLLQQIATQLGSNKVFWYEFRPGLFSLDDVLMQLARFLINHSAVNRCLIDELNTATTSEIDKIELLINRLNAGAYFLFFDAIHYIEHNSATESLLVLLKERLQQGTIFLAGREQPTFYKKIDEFKHVVYTIRLDGLTIEETHTFFERHGLNLQLETVKSFHYRLGGLPLALELAVALLAENFDESQLVELIDNTQEEIVKFLFIEVYELLTPGEKAVLTLASLFHWPFPQEQLFKIYSFLYGQPASKGDFVNLQRRLLIQSLGKSSYQIHEMIRVLALAFDNSVGQYRITVANYLAVELSDIYEAQLEAILLYLEAKAFEQAAELTTSMVDHVLVPYEPRIAETLLNVFKEDKISQEQWMWLTGSKGNLARFWRRFDQALEHYHRMLDLAEKQENKRAIAVSFQRLGILYCEHDVRIAEQYYLNSLALKKELGDIPGQAQVHNNLGSLYIQQGRFTDARLVLDRGLALRDEINEPDWQKLHLYGNMGQLHAEQEQWDIAAQFHGRVLKIAEDVKAFHEMALATYNLGVDADRQGDQLLALKFYNNALQIAQAQRLWNVEELIHIALGKLHDELGNYDKAIAHFHEVANIQSEIDDKARLATTHFDIGTFYWHKAELQQAVDYYGKGIEIFEHLAPNHEKVNLFLGKIRILASQAFATRPLVGALKQLKNRLLAQTPSYALARVYVTLGEIYLDHLHLDRLGFACIKQAAILHSELEQWEEQIQELTYLGVKYEEREQFANAIDVLTQATEIAQSQSLRRLLAIAFYDRANCYAILEMWPQAERDYQTALQTAIEIGDDKLYDAIQHNLGEMYRRKGEIEDALPLLQKCLEFAQRHNNIDDQLRTLNNLGLVYAALSYKKTALAHFETALTLVRQHYRKQDEATVLISLGNFYIEDEQPDQAKNYYEQAREIALLTENIALEEDSVLALAYAHRQLGTFEQIEEEFKKVAERASTLKHYERLIQFLILAGQINLVNEKEPKAAATSFEQALTIGLAMTLQRAIQFEKHTEQPELSPEIRNVFRDICLAINNVLQTENWSLAREFYEILFDRVKDHKIFEVLIQYLSPIRIYLDEMPQQPFVDYLSVVWSQFSNNVE